jgi:DNA polymerase-3 subunit chi
MDIRPEIRFYHLQTQSAEQALPGLVSRAYEGGKRLVLRLKDDGQVARVNETLWTFNPNSFLPHGSIKDGQPEEQPVWLTAANENPNGADTLVSLDLGDEAWDEKFSLVCLVFEGSDEAALTVARAKWKVLKDSGAALTYWQQSPQGGWEKK